MPDLPLPLDSIHPPFGHRWVPLMPGVAGSAYTGFILPLPKGFHMRVALFPVLLLGFAAALPMPAQGRPNPELLLAEQRKAMAALAFMDGQWRGSAWTLLPSGEKHLITQTERVGPMLDGTLKVVEGRGYDASGKVAFNAFAVISYNPTSKALTMRSHAQGMVGEYTLTPTVDGFSWEIPAGPMTIRYTAVVKDGTWKEVGDRILPGKDPVRFLEMTLKRIGDSAWPAAGAVGLK